MPVSQSTYHSKLYRAFQEIDASDYRTQVRFFEERSSAINQLEEEEYFELLFTYMNALFELGMYSKFLQKVDKVLELTIQHNIEFFKGKDLFCELLYQKAAAHYQMMEYEQAKHTSKELLKIDVDHPEISILLKRILRKSQPNFTKLIQAIAIVLFLVAAAVIAIEIFYFRPFLPEYVSTIEMSRIALLVGGILVYALGELFLLWRAERDVQQFTKEIRQRKGLL